MDKSADKLTNELDVDKVAIQYFIYMYNNIFAIELSYCTQIHIQLVIPGLSTDRTH